MRSKFISLLFYYMNLPNQINGLKLSFMIIVFYVYLLLVFCIPIVFYHVHLRERIFWQISLILVLL